MLHRKAPSFWGDVAAQSPSLFRGELPVFGIFLDEGLEFCRELTWRLHRRELLPEGWAVRLPTRKEWFAACGSIPSLSELGRYCYSRQLARHRRRDGLLPVNDSVTVLDSESGLRHMLGNLAEWCTEKPEFKPWRNTYRDGTVRYPVMGWSYDDDPRKVALEQREPANRRCQHLGFRPVIQKISEFA